MTREEAVKRIKEIQKLYVFTPTINEALDLAIEALKGDFHCPKCGTIVRDGRQYHDLVYRGEAEKLQLSGETSTISEETSTNSNKNSKDNLSFSKSVKLINPCNSLLKPDSDECKEQKSKLDCISRQQAVEAIEKEIERIRENPCAIATEGDFYYQNALKLAQEIIELQPPVTPIAKTQQADTLIIADALRSFSLDCGRHVSDRERAGELREQVLAYGASMCQPVTPTERTGEWVEVEKNEYEGFSIVNMRCNQCGRYAYLVLPKGTKCVYDYCPWCKASMKGGTENE